MNNIQFDGAYLFGFDFTNAQIHGLQFANAVLVGVNFGGATLSVNSILVFRCLLEGTNLAAATLQENISLADSFVDFSALSNVMYLVLSADHAVFPGYWRAPGKTVCAEMSYSGPSIVPANNPAITCPDGSSNSGGCGSTTPGSSYWESSVDITQCASYQFDATYAKAQSPPTCKADPLWVRFNVAEQQRKTQ